MSVVRLYPLPSAERPLQGCYLDLNLHRHTAGQTLIYANYIASLDGRISLPDPHSGEFGVPAAIANRRDWRLYQELAAQADVMITSARYFRQLAEGCAQDLLPVGSEPDYADLRDWRQAEGMTDQPDVIVLSRSLDIPAKAIERLHGRRIIVLSPAGGDPGRVHRLEQQGVEVVAAPGDVDAALIRQTLRHHGYRTAYMIAGPEVHRTLLADRGVDRLFLTTRHTLLGGESFHTILEGTVPKPAEMELLSLYLDPTPECRQTFAHYLLRS